MQRPIKYQVISLTITGASAVISSSNVKTNDLYKKVTGIYLTTSDALGIGNSTFDTFRIDTKEIYPTGFEAKLISTGQEVNPNDKFDQDIDERAENSQVDITYRDGGAASAYPYTVRIYLRLENDSPQSLLRDRFIKWLFGMFSKFNSESK